MKFRVNSRGQATSEMILVLPLFIGLIGGGMFVVYSGWQAVRAQQAANLAARIEGQEHIRGGTSQQAIEQENGADENGDQDPTNAPPGTKWNGTTSTVPNNNVFGKYYTLVKDEFFPNVKSQVYIPPPLPGQNIDQVKVVRMINFPKIPFFNWGSGTNQQMQLEGIAWGGEDAYAYGLPRWGKVNGSNDSEWRTLTQQSNANNQSHD